MLFTPPNWPLDDSPLGQSTALTVGIQGVSTRYPALPSKRAPDLRVVEKMLPDPMFRDIFQLHAS
jgi:hypothetical protein